MEALQGVGASLIDARAAQSYFTVGFLFKNLELISIYLNYLSLFTSRSVSLLIVV